MVWTGTPGSGNLTADGNILPDGDGTRDLGATATPWNLPTFYLKGQKIQAFSFRINNNAGTLEGRWGSIGNIGVAPSFADKITGTNISAFTIANTTQADASTAFTSGAKLSSVDTQAVVFDTAAQTQADFVGLVNIIHDSTTTALTAQISVDSRNINGTTQTRLTIYFKNATTGANFALTTANIGAGTRIDINVICFLA